MRQNSKGVCGRGKQTPDPLAGFERGKEWRREGKGRGGKERGREGREREGDGRSTQPPSPPPNKNSGYTALPRPGPTINNSVSKSMHKEKQNL